MAEKILKKISFPGSTDIYKIPDIVDLAGIAKDDVGSKDDLKEYPKDYPGVCPIGPDGKIPTRYGAVINDKISSTETCYSSEKTESLFQNKSIAFVAGDRPPVNKMILWIDTTPITGGLKYWNGEIWTHVPVAYH